MIQGGESFRLVVRRGPQPNQTYELNKDIITLGRDITNDIVINDPEVSRHHMRMTRGPGGFTIEDLGSTNGTFVNGQRVTGARPLRAGDMIGLGETVTLGYESLGAAVPQPGQPAPGAAASPYQPPPAAGVAPMNDAPASSPSGAPYQPPAGAPGASYQPPAAGSGQPYSYTPGSGASTGYQNQPGSAYTPAGAGYSPANAPMTAVPGYAADYDPQAVRTDDPRNTTRWVLIGCAGLGLFCCCSSVLGLVIVDTLCLWDRIPILWDILRALGAGTTC